MPDRMVVLKGPFTDHDIQQIVEVAQQIEESRPDEVFHVLLNAEEDADVVQFLEDINPLRQGYSRVVRFFSR